MMQIPRPSNHPLPCARAFSPTRSHYARTACRLLSMLRMLRSLVRISSFSCGSNDHGASQQQRKGPHSHSWAPRPFSQQLCAPSTAPPHPVICAGVNGPHHGRVALNLQLPQELLRDGRHSGCCELWAPRKDARELSPKVKLPVLGVMQGLALAVEPRGSRLEAFRSVTVR